MQYSITIKKNNLINALEHAIASLKRASSKAQNPAITQLLEQDITELKTALNSIQEIKQK